MTVITRRRLVGAGIAAATATAFSSIVDAGRVLAATTSDVFATSGNFKPLVGTNFSVRLATRTVTMKLVRVTDFRLPTRATSSTQGPTGPGYSLVFDASNAGAFRAGTRTVTHPRLGTFKMFIAPIGQKRQAESVINRMR